MRQESTPKKPIKPDSGRIFDDYSHFSANHQPGKAAQASKEYKQATGKEVEKVMELGLKDQTAIRRKYGGHPLTEED